MLLLGIRNRSSTQVMTVIRIIDNKGHTLSQSRVNRKCCNDTLSVPQII